MCTCVVENSTGVPRSLGMRAPLLAALGRVLKTRFPDRKLFISHLNVTEMEQTGGGGVELMLMTRRKRPNVSAGGRTASIPSALLLR